MGKKRKLLDEYRFPGFRPKAEIKGIFGDPKARVIKLERTQKKQYAGNVARFIEVITTRRCDGYEIYHVEMHG
jgi:hypothetical protein